MERTKFRLPSSRNGPVQHWPRTITCLCTPWWQRCCRGPSGLQAHLPQTRAGDHWAPQHWVQQGVAAVAWGGKAGCRHHFPSSVSPTHPQASCLFEVPHEGVDSPEFRACHDLPTGGGPELIFFISCLYILNPTENIILFSFGKTLFLKKSRKKISF